MTSSSITDKALLKSIQLHQGQTRKHDGKTPFIVHPVGVGFLVAHYTKDEDIIAAALLHDTIEDTAYTKEELLADFGPRVAGMVLDVTEPPRSEMAWKERKQWYIVHLKKAGYEARLISLADKINNLTSMMDGYRIEGEAMWKKFNSDKTLWYYEEIYRVVKDDAALSPIVKIYGATLKEAHKLFGSA